MGHVRSLVRVDFSGRAVYRIGSKQQALSAALAAITAAVVGVILNLAIWFGLHTLFGQVEVRHAYGLILQAPVLGTLNVAALVLSVAAMLALFRFKVGMIATLIGCSIAGIAFHFAGLV